MQLTCIWKGITIINLLLLLVIWEGYGYANPNITLNKGVSPKTVTRGETITYTISYKNIGTDTAYNVKIEDEIPSPTRYILNSAGVLSGPSAAITYSHNFGSIYDENQEEPITHIRWEIGGGIPPDGEGAVFFSVRIR